MAHNTSVNDIVATAPRIPLRSGVEFHDSPRNAQHFTTGDSNIGIKNAIAPESPNHDPARLYATGRKTRLSKIPNTPSATHLLEKCARALLQNRHSAYRRGLKITAANGGMLTSIDAGRPWLSTGSA